MLVCERGSLPAARAAVVNGVIAVPVMAIMMLVASSPRIMGKLPISPRLRVLGWLCTAIMAAAAIAMIAAAFMP